MGWALRRNGFVSRAGACVRRLCVDLFPSVEGERDCFGWGRPAVKQGPDAKGLVVNLFFPRKGEGRFGVYRPAVRQGHTAKSVGVDLPSEEEEGRFVRMSTRCEAGTDGRRLKSFSQPSETSGGQLAEGDLWNR